MERFRGFAVATQEVAVGGRKYRVLAPADCEVLLADPRVESRFAQDEYMPYWATLWPGAFALAEQVAAWTAPADDQPPSHVLELGCGLGLVSLVLLDRGHRVTATDYDLDALAFVEESARRNGLPPPETRPVDWRGTYDDLRPDRILAADVLYESRNLGPIAEFVRGHLRPGGFALVSDANRSTAERFEDIARECGLDVRVESWEGRDGVSGAPISARVYQLQHCAGAKLRFARE